MQGQIRAVSAQNVGNVRAENLSRRAEANFVCAKSFTRSKLYCIRKHKEDDTIQGARMCPRPAD
jgi:hypothetical protein